MSRRTLVPFLLVPTLIVLFGAATVAAASGGSPPGGAPWPGTAICAQGTLALSDGGGPNSIGLAGSIQPCAGADPATVTGARWGIAKYRTAGAYVFEDSVRTFGSPTAPTAFDVEIMVNGYETAVWGTLRAACVITAPGVRVACVEITTQWNGTLLVEPIPVSDPRVTASVTVVASQGPDPECGACV